MKPSQVGGLISWQYQAVAPSVWQSQCRWWTRFWPMETLTGRLSQWRFYLFIFSLNLRMDRIEKLENILSAATNLSTPSPQPLSRPLMVDSETQTLSTGDIVITKVFFPEGQQPSSQVKSPYSSLYCIVLLTTHDWFSFRIPHHRTLLKKESKFQYEKFSIFGVFFLVPEWKNLWKVLHIFATKPSPLNQWNSFSSKNSNVFQLKSLINMIFKS